MNTQIKRKRLKRKWLVIFTVIITLLSKTAIEITIHKIDYINKKAEQCDIEHGQTCSSYQLRHYILDTSTR